MFKATTRKITLITFSTKALTPTLMICQFSLFKSERKLEYLKVARVAIPLSIALGGLLALSCDMAIFASSSHQLLDDLTDGN